MNARPPSLDDLICLNREIAALVRAGIPLEPALKGMSSGQGRRLQQLTDRLSQRLSAGGSLTDAIAAEGPAVSTIYTAVIEAGLASGNLAQALQSLAESGQMMQETRRRIALAAVYPLMCLTLGYLIFLMFICSPGLPMFEEFFPQNSFIHYWKLIAAHSHYFTIVVPVVIVSVVVVVYLLRNGILRGVWQKLTSFRWLVGRSLNWSQFTELLALQVEHHAPLAQSIVRAADATGDPRWQREAHAVAQRLTDGATLEQSLQEARRLPPLARWMLVSGSKQGTLVAVLHHLSDAYRRQAVRRAAIIRIWVPVVFTIGIAGTVTLAYAVAFFLPLRIFLQGLMSP